MKTSINKLIKAGLAGMLILGQTSIESCKTPEKAYQAAPITLEQTVSKEETAMQKEPIKHGIWETLDQGLQLTTITPDKKSQYGDSKITVLKIDPKEYSFKLMSASEYGMERTAKDWAEKYGLLATINAGMFEEDLSNVGFMQNYKHLNNPNFKKGYNSILAFNPKTKDVPQMQIIDTGCQSFDQLKKKYNSLSQSLRMISCTQKNRWTQQPRMWSTAAIGTDKKGNALFIHSRSPYTVHDFIDALLESQLDIYNAMYLEGGPEASLYINLPNRKESHIGSYETSFNENDNNHEFWLLPNIIGIQKK